MLAERSYGAIIVLMGCRARLSQSFLHLQCDNAYTSYCRDLTMVRLFITVLRHSLTRVLEHQRYDAAQWIKVHADRVRNVAQLDNHVQQYNQKYPNNPITADQVKTDLRAAEKISDEIDDVAQFSQLLPARRLSNAEVLFDSELSGS